MRRVPLVLCLALYAAVACAQSPSGRYRLAIGYKLPSDPNLRADALAKEAQCRAMRVTSNAACQTGDTNCLGQSELSFRTCLAGIGIPGAHFELMLFPDSGSSLDVMPLSDRVATDPDWNPALNQMPLGTYYAYMGLYWLPGHGCTFYRTSDDAIASTSDSRLICEAIQDAVASPDLPLWELGIQKKQYDLLDYLFANGLDPREVDLLQVLTDDRDDPAMVEYLVQRGVPFGKYEVLNAVGEGDPDVVQVLLRHGGDAIVACKEAIFRGKFQTFRSICSPHLEDVIASVQTSCTPAAIHDRASTKTIQQLSRTCCPVRYSVRDEETATTPSEYASKYQNLKTWCLGQLGDLSALTGAGGLGYVSRGLLHITTLSDAIGSQNLPVIAYLLNHGASLDENSVREAGGSGNVKLVALVLRAGLNSEARKTLCAAVAAEAADNSDSAVLELLVRRGIFDSTAATDNLDVLADSPSPEVAAILLALKPDGTVVRKTLDEVQQELQERLRAGPDDGRYVALGRHTFDEVNKDLEAVAGLLQNALHE